MWHEDDTQLWLVGPPRVHSIHLTCNADCDHSATQHEHTATVQNSYQEKLKVLIIRKFNFRRMMRLSYPKIMCL